MFVHKVGCKSWPDGKISSVDGLDSYGRNGAESTLVEVSHKFRKIGLRICVAYKISIYIACFGSD